jgi:transcriptional regulator with XRE-family HTH domain
MNKIVNRQGEATDMFGERLRLARKRAGLSLRDLAARIGNDVSAQAISKYESGKMFPSSSGLG